MPELPRDLERRLLREFLVSWNVKSQLEPEHVVACGEPAADEVTELWRGRPFPRPLLDVAVREHEPARHLGQRIDGRVRVLGRLQPVRPVDGRRHARVDRLEGGEQVAGIYVLRPEPLAGLQVVPDEVLRQRPVGAVAAHRGLPHVTVRVDHARRHDATGRVDLQRPLGHLQLRPDRRDVLPGDQERRPRSALDVSRPWSGPCRSGRQSGVLRPVLRRSAVHQSTNDLQYAEKSAVSVVSSLGRQPDPVKGH